MKMKICRFHILFLWSICIAGSNCDPQVEDVQVYDDEVYESPRPLDARAVYLAENFDNFKKSTTRWIKSEALKADVAVDEEAKKYDGEWNVEPPIRWGLHGDQGLVLKTEAKHAAISSLLDKPFEFVSKPLIVQYEVTFQDGQTCGGAYLKLLTKIQDLKTFHDKTPYSIMFGPDRCGNENKLHFIFQHYNPINGSMEEKHCNQPKDRFDDIYVDKQPHLFTLIVKPDNTFEISLDGKVVNTGSLLEDFTPPVNPPAEIDDPNDRKPENWDDREKIPDPEAQKPEEWDDDALPHIPDPSAYQPDDWLSDEPLHIPDENAKIPSDWDTEMDGEWEPPLIDNPKCAAVSGCGVWEAPLISNPDYKGKWKAPLIDNPNYQGKWRPRRIPNPDYFEDTDPFKMSSIVAVGFELWSMSKDIYFDNILITDSIKVARHWADSTYEKKKQRIIQNSTTFWGRLMRKMNYKPFAWLLYATYCAIPIGFYIWYLYNCVKEASLIQRLAIWTNKYPILWVLYIILLCFPVVFIIYFCCKPSPPSKKEKDEAAKDIAAAAASTAEHKKTDEPTEDDVVEESRNDNREESNEPEDQPNEIEPEIDREKDSGPDSEEEEGSKVDEGNESQQESSKGAGDGARKRKVRKE